MRRSRALVPVLLAVGVVLVSAAALARALIRDADDIGRALRDASWQWLVPAAMLALLSIPCLAERWRAALRLLGTSVPLGVAVRDFSAGQLGKYVPGGVWQFVGQGELAARRGIPRRAAYASVMLSTLCLVGGAALIVAAAGLSAVANSTTWWTVAVGATVVTTLLVRPGRLAMARLLKLDAPVRAGEIARNVLGALPTWLLIGTATWMATRSMVDLPVVDVITAAVASWLAGIVFLPAPGGIGVREAVFAASLVSIDPSVSPGTAAVIALIARVLFMCADAAWLPLGRLVTRDAESWRAPSSTAAA
ncbi:MAG: lysylphosphatidylglycerol synthase transmembrane domain-containing protein [Ilumatobacteraceae bacterium]